MGSGPSREDVIASKWWEAKALKMLRTNTISNVEIICPLVPIEDDKTAIGFLETRPDLDTIFALHYRYHELSMEQRADPSALTADFKANELWRVLRMSLKCSECPWDDWQLPREGTPSEIAAKYHAAVCQAISQIPLSDFVKYALGYTTKAHFLNALLEAVCKIRDTLRIEFLDQPQMKKTYVNVEKVLEQRYHPLACWIVASSLQHSAISLHSTLAPNLEPIQTIFAIRDFDLVLKRLAALERRVTHGSQMYNRQEWSTDLDFWHCIEVAIWLGKFTTPSMQPHLSSEDQGERLRFLEGFETDPEDKAGGRWSKVRFSMKRLIVGLRNSEG